MIGKGPVISDPIQRLVMHKEYVVEMFNSIIKEMDLDPCGELTTEDLRDSSLYDLSRVRICCFKFGLIFVYFS